MAHSVLKAIEAAVGVANFSADTDSATHNDPYSFGQPGRFKPGAVAKPANTEELRAILAIAREHRLPLWTVSTGKNLGYGGAAPRTNGAVVVDLSRMNRVLEVNEELGYAVVEPGVSFLALHAHLKVNGNKLMMSVPDIGWGSPIGNALERGFGYSALWDHSNHLCGLEVMLASGALVRTGMGAMSGSTAFHAYQGGFGPRIDGLFQQSNFGIVTRAGISLMRQPETIITCHVKAPRVSDVGALTVLLRPLILDGTIQSNAIIGNATVIATMMSERSRWWTELGAIPEPVVQQIADGLGVGRWNARFGLYGPEAMTAARLATVRHALASIPGLDITTRSYAGEPDPAKVHPADFAQLGIPSLALLRMAEWRGGTTAHTDFSLVCPATAVDVERQRALMQSTVEAHGFDYAGGFTLGGRHAIALALIAFDRDNAAEAAQVETLFGDLIDKGASASYAPYRAHLAFMDRIKALYDFNDHALGKVTQTIKDALDPCGILSPGKQGIWPSNFEATARATK